ncbi:MAG: tetratricopeptide repeat protein [Planctomycetes bacterium]|nr:tetratricopeptide repeat protein [Planctomycetota bacterium]
MSETPSFEELSKLGRGHLKAGRLDEALSAFTAAASLNDLDPGIHDALGMVHFLQHNYPGAIQHYERVTRLDPRRGSAWINLGAVYNRMADYPKAVEVLRRAVQIEKKSSAGYYNLGIAYKHLKQWALAVPAYREAIRLEPKMAEAYLNLGNVYTAMKNYTQAASNYRKALDLKPGLERAVRGLEQAENAIREAKSHNNPFGRLVDPSHLNAAAATPAVAAHELAPDERQRDRSQLHALLVKLEDEFQGMTESLEDQVHASVRTLNKMLTQPLSPHGVSISREDALDQFREARAQFAPRLAQFQATLKQLREHEAQFQ